MIPTTTTTFSKISRPFTESNTYSFGPKEFKTNLDSSIRREKARQTVQSKYLNNQMNRTNDHSFYEQKVNSNYQKKTVGYAPPPDSAFRSSTYSEGFKKNPYDTFENIVNKHAKPKVISRSNVKSNKMDIIGKKKSKKIKEGKANDPNTIEFSNKNGPETFTITHKTYNFNNF